MENLYYTPLEVAERLPISRSGVYKLLKTGEIPRKRIGKKYVIPRGAFEKWLATCDMPEARPGAAV